MVGSRLRASLAGVDTTTLRKPILGLVSGLVSRYLVAASATANHMRRSGRVVECTALEMRHACKGIGGSNPSFSAI